MRTDEVEANLVRLNEQFKLLYLDELISRKLNEHEQATLADVDLAFHQREYERLQGELESSFIESTLPEAPSGKAALHDLLVRLRMRRA